MIGYIVGIKLQSGLASIQIAKRPRGKAFTTVYVDAGFGVRQIVDFFGSWAAMETRGPVTRLRFQIAGQVLNSFANAHRGAA